MQKLQKKSRTHSIGSNDICLLFLLGITNKSKNRMRLLLLRNSIRKQFIKFLLV